MRLFFPINPVLLYILKGVNYFGLYLYGINIERLYPIFNFFYFELGVAETYLVAL